MSETCKRIESSISALIDGELETPEQLPVIDHLVVCESCRAFYRRARALDDMVVASRSQDVEPAPEAVWERIAAASGWTDRSLEPRGGGARRLPKWGQRALELAAVLVLALGIWWLKPAPEPPSVPDDEVADKVDVVLEEDRGSMTEERFLEITTEILRADRSYHRKMYEVMSVVTAMTERPEGAADDPAIPSRENIRRISLGEDDGDESLVWKGDRL